MKSLILPILTLIIIFTITYPGVIVLKDEANYIRQAHAFAEGAINVDRYDPYSGEKHRVRVSDYPPGTSFVTAFFVKAGGWQASFWMSLLALVGAVIITGLFLKIASLSPVYALILLIFPPALVMGRVVSSDVISATVVATGLWAFWAGLKTISKETLKWNPYWFTAGLIAGLSLLFRESNALIFAPLFLGAVIRKEKEWVWLLIGGLAGVMARLAASITIFGSAFYAKDPQFGFSFAALLQNLPAYLTALLIMVPGGLLFTLFYQGKRKPEVITTIFLFTAFYLFYGFSGQMSGGLIQWVLGPRFYIPLLPLFALVLAEVLPRLTAQWALIDENWFLFRNGVFVGILILIVVIHTGMDRWTEVHRDIQNIITETVPAGSTVIMNNEATLTYINELQGYTERVDFVYLQEENLGLPEQAYVVFLQRTGSDYWRNFAQQENEFLNRLQGYELFNESLSGDYHLKIFTLTKSHL